MKKYYSAGGMRLAVRTGDTLNWLLGDHLGSTNSTADGSGIQVGKLLYKPWGEERFSSGTTPTTFKFTGQRQESSFGLYLYGSRWYDPYLNRWTSPDTIIPDPQNPQDLDRYAYARNNPVKYVDPTGHWVETALDIAFIAFDLYQINQEGWTPVNTVALIADVACAIVPIGTGGGPAVRAAMSGGDAVLTYTRAAAQVPDVIRAGQAAEKLLQFADSSNGNTETSRTQGHHPWPQYLLGPEKQELYNLDSKLHIEYHSQLDRYLSRRFGTENYVNLFDTQEKINQLLEGLMEFNKYFDETYKTHTYEALEDVLRNERYLPKP